MERSRPGGLPQWPNVLSLSAQLPPSQGHAGKNMSRPICIDPHVPNDQFPEPAQARYNSNCGSFRLLFLKVVVNPNQYVYIDSMPFNII